ncbi:MAG: hypothetical protein J0M34_01105 [Alphaproteobacteria bacterium]|nr:hypothetical protein [Alphaproteobacteria bacterium]
MPPQGSGIIGWFRDFFGRNSAAPAAANNAAGLRFEDGPIIISDMPVDPTHGVVIQTYEGVTGNNISRMVSGQNYDLTSEQRSLANAIEEAYRNLPVVGTREMPDGRSIEVRIPLGEARAVRVDGRNIVFASTFMPAQEVSAATTAELQAALAERARIAVESASQASFRAAQAAGITNLYMPTLRSNAIGGGNNLVSATDAGAAIERARIASGVEINPIVRLMGGEQSQANVDFRAGVASVVESPPSLAAIDNSAFARDVLVLSQSSPTAAEIMPLPSRPEFFLTDAADASRVQSVIDGYFSNHGLPMTHQIIERGGRQYAVFYTVNESDSLTGRDRASIARYMGRTIAREAGVASVEFFVGDPSSSRTLTSAIEFRNQILDLSVPQADVVSAAAEFRGGTYFAMLPEDVEHARQLIRENSATATRNKYGDTTTAFGREISGFHEVSLVVDGQRIIYLGSGDPEFRFGGSEAELLGREGIPHSGTLFENIQDPIELNRLRYKHLQEILAQHPRGLDYLDSVLPSVINPILTESDSTQLRMGATTTFEIPSHPADGASRLVVLRRNAATGDGLSLVGGGGEGNETPLITLRREMAEEFGHFVRNPQQQAELDAVLSVLEIEERFAVMDGTVDTHNYAAQVRDVAVTVNGVEHNARTLAHRLFAQFQSDGPLANAEIQGMWYGTPEDSAQLLPEMRYAHEGLNLARHPMVASHVSLEADGVLIARVAANAGQTVEALALNSDARVPMPSSAADAINTGNITVLASDLPDNSISAVNRSRRALLRINLTDSAGFNGNPDLIVDAHGRPSLLGIASVNRNPNTGALESVTFINPKDSAGVSFTPRPEGGYDIVNTVVGTNYNIQTYPVNDGILIVPADELYQVRALQDLIFAQTGQPNADGVITANIQQFDGAIRDAHTYFTSEGLIADLYSSTMADLYDTEAAIFKRHEAIEGSIWRKNANITFHVVRVPAEYQGTDGGVQRQFYESRFVVVNEGGVSRAVAYDYAVENFTQRDGSPIDWNVVDTVNPLELADVRSRMGLTAPVESIGTFMHSNVTVIANDLTADPVPAVNLSRRTLLRINLTDVVGYNGNPGLIRDAHGRPSLLGIASVNRNPNTGALESVTFINPKDSAGVNFTERADGGYDVVSTIEGTNYNIQTYPFTDGVLIVPADETSQVQELHDMLVARLGQPNAEGVITANIEQFDGALRDAHNYFTREGLVPDLYSSNYESMYEPGTNTPKNHEPVEGNVWRKNAKITFHVVRVPAEYRGTDGGVQRQFYETRFVVVNEGGVSRAVAYDYAVENFRQRDGSAIDWNSIDTVNPMELGEVRARMGLTAPIESIGTFVDMEQRIPFDVGEAWADAAHRPAPTDLFPTDGRPLGGVVDSSVPPRIAPDAQIVSPAALTEILRGTQLALNNAGGAEVFEVTFPRGMNAIDRGQILSSLARSGVNPDSFSLSGDRVAIPVTELNRGTLLSVLEHSVRAPSGFIPVGARGASVGGAAFGLAFVPLQYATTYQLDREAGGEQLAYGTASMAANATGGIAGAAEAAAWIRAGRAGIPSTGVLRVAGSAAIPLVLAASAFEMGAAYESGSGSRGAAAAGGAVGGIAGGIAGGAVFGPWGAAIGGIGAGLGGAVLSADAFGDDVQRWFVGMRHDEALAAINRISALRTATRGLSGEALHEQVRLRLSRDQGLRRARIPSEEEIQRNMALATHATWSEFMADVDISSRTGVMQPITQRLITRGFTLEEIRRLTERAPREDIASTVVNIPISGLPDAFTIPTSAEMEAYRGRLNDRYGSAAVQRSIDLEGRALQQRANERRPNISEDALATEHGRQFFDRVFEYQYRFQMGAGVNRATIIRALTDSNLQRQAGLSEEEIERLSANQENVYVIPVGTRQSTALTQRLFRMMRIGIFDEGTGATYRQVGNNYVINMSQIHDSLYPEIRQMMEEFVQNNPEQVTIVKNDPPQPIRELRNMEFFNPEYAPRLTLPTGQEFVSLLSSSGVDVTNIRDVTGESAMFASIAPDARSALGGNVPEGWRVNPAYALQINRQIGRENVGTTVDAQTVNAFRIAILGDRPSERDQQRWQQFLRVGPASEQGQQLIADATRDHRNAELLGNREFVMQLQRMASVANRELPIDGVYGQRTSEALEQLTSNQWDEIQAIGLGTPEAGTMLQRSVERTLGRHVQIMAGIPEAEQDGIIGRRTRGALQELLGDRYEEARRAGFISEAGYAIIAEAYVTQQNALQLQQSQLEENELLRGLDSVQATALVADIQSISSVLSNVTYVDTEARTVPAILADNQLEAADIEIVLQYLRDNPSILGNRTLETLSDDGNAALTLGDLQAAITRIREQSAQDNSIQ